MDKKTWRPRQTGGGGARRGRGGNATTSQADNKRQSETRGRGTGRQEVVA